MADDIDEIMNMIENMKTLGTTTLHGKENIIRDHFNALKMVTFPC